MLEVVGVVVGEAGSERLNRCSLTVRPGEVLGVVGPTGSGKTTLLEVMAGHLAPTRGRLTWEGREVTRSPDRLRAVTGLAPQSLPGPLALTAIQWLRLHAALDAAPTTALDGVASELLARFELTAVRDRRVSSLSRGMGCRLGLARLFLRGARVLLLDGPDEGVDGAGLRVLTQLIKDASASGRAVVLSSVAPHLPTMLCDRVAVLQGGATAQEHTRGAPGYAAAVAAAQGWAS